MALYEGIREDGTAHVLKDGEELDPKYSLSVRNHSPAGFNWGYGGSGPAQLALAILLEETDRGTAVALYQKFKWSFVGSWQGERWTLTSEQVRAWLSLPDLP